MRCLRLKVCLLAAFLAFLARPAIGTISNCSCAAAASSTTTDSVFSTRVEITTNALGARCSVAADFNKDGYMDLVVASATDNKVSWFKNDGSGGFGAERPITFRSEAARIVTTGDIDADGWTDVIVASYYDNTVGWYKNIPDPDAPSERTFGSLVVVGRPFQTQGVAVADIDDDGDLDVVSASSGDHTIAWYENLGQDGRFCEQKRVVDTNAQGARTVVVGDFDGDGYVDIASASKNDDTIAWYPNTDGRGSFTEKRVITNTADGAYSAYAIDVDKDGRLDLVTASNEDDTVAFWRNLDGGTSWEQIVIFNQADFVLSVFAADLDHDGDIDVASASFFDHYIRWYENTNANGDGRQWTPHEIYLNNQGHYVSGADMDNDGDVDLIGTFAGGSMVSVFIASTNCDAASPTQACCIAGQEWDSAAGQCVACVQGKYSTQNQATSGACLDCPTNACKIGGLTSLPWTCQAPAGCNDIPAAYAECDCAQDGFLNSDSVCTSCPAGQIKPYHTRRTSSDFRTSEDDDYLWEGFDGDLCEVAPPPPADEGLIIALAICGSVVAAMLLVALIYGIIKAKQNWTQKKRAEENYKQIIRDRIDKACAATKTCMFNVCFIKYTIFKEAGKLLRHETHRERGNIVSLDTYEEVFAWVAKHATMFVSHQWLGFTEPDPDNIHFPAICSACEDLCKAFKMDEDELYVWVDYTSIPQANNYLKGLSIASLAVYASVVRYFVIIAPKCIHKDKGTECSAETYQKRGWCRLEQWARMTVGGLHDMYLHEDGKLHKIVDKPSWYGQSIRVFEGDFTCDSDKYALVDTVMGLWYVALLNESHADNSLLKNLVEENKADVFPKLYFENYIEQLEAKVNERIAKENHHAELIRAFTKSRSLEDVGSNGNQEAYSI